MSFIGIYVYTRYASPAEYGLFALVTTVAQMCQSVLFYWIQVGATRNIEAARAANRLPVLEAAVYRCHGYTFIIFAAIYAALVAFLPLSDTTRRALCLGSMIVGLRSLVSINQALHLGSLRSARFNAIECAQSIIAFSLGAALLTLSPARTSALLGALIASSMIVMLPDVRMVIRAWQRPVQKDELTALFAFGIPLSVSFALYYVLASADRLLIQYFLGEEMVGVYSIAYSLVDRAMGSVIVAVTVAAYPMAIRAYELDGVEGAQRQMRSNGRVLLAVAVPSCAILAALSPQLAAVMIGPAFRNTAQSVMPWIALSALMSGFQIHFFDHAFHIKRLTRLSLWATGPAALLNIALNVILLPRLGIMGAVWATLISYSVSLAISVAIGFRVFRVPLDWNEALRVSGATAAMAASIEIVRPSVDLAGLITGAGVAVIVYVAVGFGLNILDARRWVVQRLRWA